MSDVTSWLQSLGLGTYADAFAAQRIELDLLVRLNEADLERLGVSFMGDRKRLLVAIAALTPTPATTTIAIGTWPRDELSTQARPNTERGYDAERRQLTVLFCDLVGSTAFSQTHDVEDVREMLSSFQAICGDAVSKYDGHIAQYLGDGVLIYFGFPLAHEDDAVRALKCGLSILAELEHSGRKPHSQSRLQARLGADTGAVLVSTLGKGRTQEDLALGDVPNVAARLQSLAQPGSLVVSSRTWQLTKGYFLFDSLGDMSLKGLSSPVRTWRVVAQTNVKTRLEASEVLSPFVGREQELAQLDAFARDQSPHVRAIEIVGEAGIGKSRLLHEGKARLHNAGIAVLGGYCSPDAKQTPLGPFVDIVRFAFRLPSGSSEQSITLGLRTGLNAIGLGTDENLGLLIHLFGLNVTLGLLAGLDGALVGLRTSDLLLRMVNEAARARPTVLLVEDLHWADTSSQSLLDRIISKSGSSSLRIVLTRRPEQTPPWVSRDNVVTMTLLPLADADTVQLVQSRLGVENLPSDLKSLLVGRAEGNALFAEELAGFLVSNGVVKVQPSGLEFNAAAVSAALPTSVKSLLTSRVDQLAPVDRALLQVAAVIGRRFDPILLSIVGVGDDVPQRLDAMRGLDLVHPDPRSGEYMFKHALVRDALYESLLRTQRAHLHFEVAMELERRYRGRLNEVAEVLAHHFAQSDRADRAVEFLTMAGAKSLGVYALDEAQRHLEQALQLAEAQSARIEPKTMVRLLMLLSELLNILCEPRRLKETIDRNRALMDQAGDLPDVVIALSHYTFAASMMRDYPAALRASDQALQIALRTNDGRCRAYARGAFIIVHAMVCDKSLEEMEQMASLACDESESAADVYLHSFIRLTSAWDYLMRGLHEKASVRSLELKQRGEAMGDPRAIAIHLWIDGWMHLFDEQWDKAYENGAECERIAITNFDRHVGTSVKGIAEVFRGSPECGLGLLAHHRAEMERCGALYVQSGSDGPIAVAMVLCGDLAGGVGFVENTIATCDRLGETHLAEFQCVYAAEILLEFLAPKERPALRVLFANLPFLLRIKFMGWRRAHELLQRAVASRYFDSKSHFRARIEMDLGLLYSLRKPSHEARVMLMRARILSAELHAYSLIRKIDAALASC